MPTNRQSKNTASKSEASPYDELQKLFHEPRRLGIVSALLQEPEGRSFVDLKQEFNMTDGNLSRHLSLLEQEGVIVLTKAFVRNKPRTTAALTEEGRAKFARYLNALEEVLRRASAGLEEESEESSVNLPKPELDGAR